ncbi:unnamed protein product [Owenia fusiformis]|uniref:Uncharacterized protein n=1 Tax=Owenia fusiformis TaxID=6347 RepID=A0A8J1XH37_OWEFU|nr:unnamed protein product [Owenia fusiformis]
MADSKQLIFRINDNGVGPEIVRHVFLERGWIEFDEDQHCDYEWNFWWKTSRFRQSDYDQLMSWQRINHYPKTSIITRKDSLARNLKRMKCVYGAGAFNFSPNAFNLPNDYKKFVGEYAKLKEKNPDEELYWICKPADMSRGRGIFIFQELNELQYDCSAVVQKYIPDPLLISGYKFDLRLYVGVPSFQPLYVYIYQEGLCRFSTEKYDLTTLHNQYSHLTNTSINKHGPSYSAEKERIGPGCKWTLTQLRYYFRQCHIDDRVLWQQIVNIIILTLVTQASEIPKVNNCYELYGFDILVDESLKPWLLEVNFSPAMSTDSPVDLLVKKPLLHDLIEMCNYKPGDVERGGNNFKQRQLRKAYASPMVSGRSSTLSQPGRWSSNSNRLPDIKPRIYNSSPRLLSRGKLRTPLKSRKGDKATGGEEEGTDDAESEEDGPVPLVPGCGLPSVQQPMEEFSNQRYSSSSSGRSSSSSSSPPGHHGSLNRPDKDIRSPGLNKIKECQISSKKRNNSKTSLCSVDSAFSSDNSESLTVAKGNKSSKRMPTLRSKSSKFSSSMQRDHESVKGMGRSLPRMISDDTQYTVEGHSKPVHKPTTTKTGSQRSSSRQHDSSRSQRSGVAFTANPIATKSFMSNRVHSHGEVHKTEARDQVSPKSKGPPQKIGGFFLTYPFNEMSRKSGANIDIKMVIRECQRLLKLKRQELNNERTKKTSYVGRDETPEVQEMYEGLLRQTSSLWGPVKTPEPE